DTPSAASAALGGESAAKPSAVSAVVTYRRAFIVVTFLQAGLGFVPLRSPPFQATTIRRPQKVFKQRKPVAHGASGLRSVPHVSSLQLRVEWQAECSHCKSRQGDVTHRSRRHKVFARHCC